MRLRIVLSLTLALAAVAAIPALADAPGAGQVANCGVPAVATPAPTAAMPAAQGRAIEFWVNGLEGGDVFGAAAGCSCSGTCGLFGTCACTSCSGCSTEDCQSCCTQGCEENCIQPQ